jgi:hypothetical protein
MNISQYIASHNRTWGDFSTTSPGNPPFRQNRAVNSAGELKWNPNDQPFSQKYRSFVVTDFNKLRQSEIEAFRMKIYEGDPDWFDAGPFQNLPSFRVLVLPRLGSNYWQEIDPRNLLNSEFYMQMRRVNTPESSRRSLFFRNSSNRNFSVGNPVTTYQLTDFPVGRWNVRLAYRGRGFINDAYISNLYTTEKQLEILPSVQTVPINRQSWHKFIQLPSQLLGFDAKWGTTWLNNGMFPGPLPDSAYTQVPFVMTSSGRTQHRLAIPYNTEIFQGTGFRGAGTNLTTIGAGRLMDFFESLHITPVGQLVYRLKAGVTFPRGASAIIPIRPYGHFWELNHTYLVQLVIQ